MKNEIKRVMPTEVWTRVVGYFRPVDQANKGKKEEIRQRKETDVKNLGAMLKK